MIATRLRLTVLAAAAVVLVSCGSSSNDSSTATTAAAGAGATSAPSTTTAGAATTVDNSGGGYGYGVPDATTTVPSPATTAASSGETSVALAAVGDFGQALVDAKGMSLYLFDTDTGGKSACSGGCATAWPPVTGSPTAGAGLDAAKLSTIARDDGTTQLVYNGHPLYTFAGDAAPGQAGGQGSGGVWWLVNAAGDKIAGID